MAHLLPINKKEFYIDLHESRYYFPGDVLKGTVVLNVGKPIKTNHIRITLTGTMQADGSTTQVLQTSCCLATSPLNDGKPHWLQAQTHRLPFEFTIPTDDDVETKLPSSFKLSSSMGVKYVITAIHDRPYVPERLSGLIKKEIRVLERIDITQPKYGAKGYVSKDVRVFGGLPSSSSDNVHLSLTLPRYAVVRGDLLPVEIHIKHYRKLARVDGIKVYLIRRVYAGKDRKKSERKSIKSNTLAIDITPEGGFEQKISTKLLVPTNTPPTLSQNGRILAVEYAARVVINVNDSYAIYPNNYIKLESHVVIGTYPEPNLSIDDDDEDTEEVEGSEDIDGSDDDDNEEEFEDGDKNNRPTLAPTTSSDQISSSSSSSAHIFEPPAMRHQSSAALHQHQQSSTPKLQQCNPRYSLSQQHQSSSSSITVVDATTPSVPFQQQQQCQSSFSLTVLDPTVSKEQHQRPLSPPQQQQYQKRQSSSSSLTVVDPTAPTVSIQTGRRHSYLPRQPSSSAFVVDPTSTTAHDPHRRTHYLPPSSTSHRQSLQHQGSASVIDPTAILHRNESTLSTFSSLSSTSSRSSSSGGSSSAMLVEPPPPPPVKHYDLNVMMKPDRNNTTASIFTPTSPTSHPMAMASMPDIAAYVPSKSSDQQQKKRPPLHLNPIATTTSSPHHHHHQQYPPPVPSSPAASTAVSPGGFVVPKPVHTPQMHPPPLPPRRPSAQQQQQQPNYYYHQHHQHQQHHHHPSSPSYSPTSPWS